MKECQICDLTKQFIPNEEGNACICAGNLYFIAPLGLCAECPYDCQTCAGP